MAPETDFGEIKKSSATMEPSYFSAI
jgi:hypothetical protein